MPPKRFEGKFGIPPSHPVESLLTQALYRLPETVSVEKIESLIRTLADKVNALRAQEDLQPLTGSEQQTLALKLARHYEDNGDATAIDIPTCVDALVESPRFLQSDKGSIAKLFELHEMKTLQKIAELRRKRAEITEKGTNESNPYENLFETTSGRYYLARLLNMPHLEDESTYMDHCVGTSTSYVSKMKKGEVEIFSFRDKATDQPVVTIEYDTRSHELLQVKAESDNIPTLADEFAPDLLEAIERLGETINDQGQPRTVESKGATHLRHLLSLREKQKANEPFSRDDLILLYELNEPIQGFDVDGREPLITVLHAGRHPQEDMLTIFDCTKEQIAHSMSEVREDTKAYVGELEPGIFQKLPEGFEHIYTSFPEKKIRREQVEIGGKSAEQLISEMEAAGINISGYAKSMLKNQYFVPGANREQATLIRLTVADLGFKTSATTAQVFERAQALGLELCPPDTGPN